MKTSFPAASRMMRRSAACDAGFRVYRVYRADRAFRV